MSHLNDRHPVRREMFDQVVEERDAALKREAVLREQVREVLEVSSVYMLPATIAALRHAIDTDAAAAKYVSIERVEEVVRAEVRRWNLLNAVANEILAKLGGAE